MTLNYISHPANNISQICWDILSQINDQKNFLKNGQLNVHISSDYHDITPVNRKVNGEVWSASVSAA